MGTLVEGILCYGFSVDNEEGHRPVWLYGDEDGEEIGIEDVLAKLYELPKPTREFDEKDTSVLQEYREYWDRKRALKETAGVDLVIHCAGEEQMYILAATASVKTAHWGRPVELGQGIQPDPSWREALRAFCERIQIPFKEPRFILCSYYG